MDVVQDLPFTTVGKYGRRARSAFYHCREIWTSCKICLLPLWGNIGRRARSAFYPLWGNMDVVQDLPFTTVGKYARRARSAFYHCGEIWPSCKMYLLPLWGNMDLMQGLSLPRWADTDVVQDRFFSFLLRGVLSLTMLYLVANDVCLVANDVYLVADDVSPVPVVQTCVYVSLWWG